MVAASDDLRKRTLNYTLALALGSAFTLVALFGTALAGVVMYVGVSDVLRAELAHRLSHATGVALLSVDAEKRALLQDPEDEDLDYYAELKERLHFAKSRSDDVAYVYTVRLVEEGETVWVRDEANEMNSRPAGPGGEVVFVVDSDPEDTYGRVREVYEDAPGLLEDALRGRAQPNRHGVYVSDDFYTDRWGTFLTGYVPIRSSDGRVRAMLCTDVAADAVLAHEQEYGLIVLGLCALVALVTIPLGFVFAAWIRTPLKKLGTEMGRIAALDLDHDEVISSRIVEVDRMGRELDNMKSGLRSFRKYVPARLVRQLMHLGVEAKLGGAREEVSILFSDITGFTSISEGQPPETLVDLLSEYLGTITDVLIDHGATVDKYMGDSVMAFWNAPVRQPDHAFRACEAVVDCGARLADLAGRWREEGRGVVFETRLGIHTGQVIVGNLGSEQRLDYTILGDHVNLASRIEGANKTYGTDALISAETYGRVVGRVVARRVDRVAVHGKTVPVELYELVGLPDAVHPTVLETNTMYEEGLELYFARRFNEAAALFGRVLELEPTDGPARVLRERCHQYRDAPRPDDWDGSHALTEK